MHVGNHYAPCIGGIERAMEDLARALSARGHLARVVCLDRCADFGAKLAAYETADNILVERIPFLDLKYYKIAPGIFSKIRDAQIIHVHGIGFFSDFLLLTKFLHGKKVVVSTHGGVFHTTELGGLKKIYFKVFQRFILGFADAIIAISKNDAQIFREISGKVVLIENGVDISRLRPTRKKKNSFLFLGRFSKNKRVELLLEAFAAADFDFKLTVAGTDWGHLYASYVKKAKELGIEGKVLFVQNPSRNQTEQLYSQSEFFVSASRYEGFGIALVEAMACGCIPLVNKNDGFSYILGQQKGFSFDYENTADAAKKLKKAVSMPAAKKEALSGKFLFRAKAFDLGKKIGELEKLYVAILAK